MADLMRYLTIPLTLEFIQASSYGRQGTEKGPRTLFGMESIGVKGKNLLIVDDIYDSSNTLTTVIQRLQEKTLASLKTLVLLNKKGS